MENEHKIEITPPHIKDDTMEEMKKFFMQTSIPRIIEKMKKEGEKNEQKS